MSNQTTFHHPANARGIHELVLIRDDKDVMTIKCTSNNDVQTISNIWKRGEGMGVIAQLCLDLGIKI